jgi:hypothetical protein
VCYIVCTNRSSVFVASTAWGGGTNPSLPHGFRGKTKNQFFLGVFCFRFLAIFRDMVFTNGFLISVKELGLLTNPGEWTRGLDVMGSYILYCIVKSRDTMNRILEVWL